jgi:hypothetical protein
VSYVRQRGIKILKFCQIYSDKTIIWEGMIVPHTLSIRGNEFFFASWVPVSISFFAKYVMVSFYVIRRNVRVRRPQSIQSAGFPSSRSNWGPYPLTRKENCFYPLWVQVDRHTRLRRRGWGDPIPTKGQTLWYYTRMYIITPLILRPTPPLSVYIYRVQRSVWRLPNY